MRIPDSAISWQPVPQLESVCKYCQSIEFVIKCIQMKALKA